MNVSYGKEGAWKLFVFKLSVIATGRYERISKTEKKNVEIFFPYCEVRILDSIADVLYYRLLMKVRVIR